MEKFKIKSGKLKAKGLKKQQHVRALTSKYICQSDGHKYGLGIEMLILLKQKHGLGIEMLISFKQMHGVTSGGRKCTTQKENKHFRILIDETYMF